MATGGSDETFNFVCTPCLKDSLQSEASVFCLDCRECLCDKCYGNHQMFSAMVVHSVLDKAEMQAGGGVDVTPLPTETCDTHPGKLIVIYCEDHDALCCAKCVSENHRSCKNAVYIPEASIGFKDSDQLKDVNASTEDLIDEIRQLKLRKQGYLQRARHDSNAILTDIHQIEMDVIKKANDLAKSSEDVVRKYFGARENAINADMKDLDDMQTDAKSLLAKLGQTGINEAQLFINEKRGRRQTDTLRKNVKDHVPRDGVLGKCLFGIKYELCETVRSLDMLETMINKDKIVRATLCGDYNLKISADNFVCSIYATCLLQDGSLVVVDTNNKRLKRLDPSYNVTDYCDLPVSAWGVACTGSDEVAVTLRDKMKVQFVSVGASMSLTKSFSTGDRCRGICYCNGKLMVSCGGSDVLGDGFGIVEVYDLAGNQIRTIEFDYSVRQTFTGPFSISSSLHDNTVYVAFMDSGVLYLDEFGNVTYSFTDPILKKAIGLCILDNDQDDDIVLVCGWGSDNVVQVTSDGRMEAELLKNTDGIHCPRSLCYNSTKKQLIVTLEENDSIRVFDLK